MSTSDVLHTCGSDRPGHIDLSDQLSDTPFTIEWLLTALSGDGHFLKLRNGSTIENVTVTYISKGIALASKVYKINVQFERSNDNFEVVLKVPGTQAFTAAVGSGDNGVSIDFIAKGHNLECAFYKQFAPHLDMPLAKVFKAVEMRPGKAPGALLMESLHERAGTFYLPTSCSRGQCFNVAKHLASFHKHFLCIPKDRWIGKYSDNAVSAFANESHASYIDQFPTMNPGVFDRAYKVLKEHAADKEFYQYMLTDVHKDIGLPLVLCHGDLHSGNLMWKLNSDGSVSNELAAMIDWQMIYEGCVTNDIAMFMATSVDGDVRRDCEYNVLKFMYDRIVALMEKEGKAVDFSYEQMKLGYRINFAGHAARLLVMLPMLYGNELNWTPQDKPAKYAERDKLLLRAQYNLEDALDCLREVPNEKYRWEQ
uniref:CHK domain-containing protein n=1 Tax=Steinernema glaseri TaxID=37863 RepID=A0A1I7ZGS3_9BILA